MTVSVRSSPAPAIPDFLDLPWSEPLEEWESPRFVDVARGIGRHVVRFVDYDGSLYALKELPPRLAQREYRLLRALARARVAGGRGGRRRRASAARAPSRCCSRATSSTRCRTGSCSTRAVLPAPLDLLLDAFAELLVRLHLAGLLLGRLLALEHALPPRRGTAVRVPRRRGDRASCTSSSPTGSARTTSSSRARTSTASCSMSATTMRSSSPTQVLGALRAAVERADARGGLRRRRALPPRASGCAV